MARAKSYDRVFNKIYSDITGVDERINALPPAEAMAFRAISVLRNRKGFDWWWEDIEPGCRSEIFAALVRVCEGKEERK